MIDFNDTLAIKDLLKTASPLIKSLVDTFVTPKLEKFRDRKKVGIAENVIPTEEDFTEYLHRTYKRLIVVNTLVFNNSQRFLNDIFLPLKLVSTSDQKKRVKIQGFPKSISDEFGNILITDTAGMGKSTLMKKIFIDSIHGSHGIPIFIELRRLNKNKTIIDEIQEQLNSINKNFDSKVVLDLLVDGGFILIFDGYDEISLADREIVTQNLQDFISKTFNNRFFLTSRPEKALNCFGNFHEFKIEPLNKNEAFELLRKYDKKGNVSSLLIKKLQETEMSNIEEFLTNPLLVSLLFTAFEYKQAIPFKKYLFYRQVYDANFESHDLTKGDSFIHNKYSKLEIDDFHRVLRHIGYNCFNVQKIEFTKDEILKLIKDSREFCAGLSFKDSDFLNDIIKTVPIFTQDGNYFRWAHKSLQEYFAAQFIYLDSKLKQNSILEKIYNHSNIENFANILDLYYDMDYKTFRNVIELRLLEDYKIFSDYYFKENTLIASKVLLKRKELMFLTDSFLFKAKRTKDDDPFRNENFHLMMNDFESSYQKNLKRSPILVNPRINNQEVYLANFQSNKKVILQLLSDKHNEVIRELDNYRKITHEVDIDFDLTDNYDYIKLNDFSDCKLNFPDNFENVNYILEAFGSNKVSINGIEALKKLKKIKSEIESESQNDFFLSSF